MPRKSFKKLLKEYKHYVEFECRKVRIPGYEIEDLKQEVLIAILLEYKKYKEDGGMSEKGWILQTIRQRLYQILRQETYPKRMPYTQHIMMRVEQLRPQTDCTAIKETAMLDEIRPSDIVSSSLFAGNCKYYETPEFKYEYKQLIKIVRRKLSPEAELIFNVKLNPPKGLVRMIERENAHRKQIKEDGYSTKEVVSVTNSMLVKYFNYQYSLGEIKEFLEEIKNTIYKVGHGTI